MSRRFSDVFEEIFGVICGHEMFDLHAEMVIFADHELTVRSGSWSFSPLRSLIGGMMNSMYCEIARIG